MAGFLSASAFGSSGLAESSTGPAPRPDSLIQYAHTDNGPPLQYADYVGVSGISDEPLPERPQEVQVIAVMGPTGSGKSTLISQLGGSAVKIGHNLKSCKSLQQSKVFIANFPSLP